MRAAGFEAVRGQQGLRQCVLDSLAAVWEDHISEELHPHDGEGVVEDDEGQSQAGNTLTVKYRTERRFLLLSGDIKVMWGVRGHG